MTDDSIPEDFQNWWDSDEKEWPDPYIRKHSALWWAYQGWVAGQKVEREAKASLRAALADKAEWIDSDIERAYLAGIEEGRAQMRREREKDD